MKPIIKFNNGDGAILCNKCSVIIKSNLTKDEFKGKTGLVYCNNCLYKLVYEYKTKYNIGFTSTEIKEIISEFPYFNKEEFHNALTSITCQMRDNQLIIYHCDVLTAIKCGMENRKMTILEFD